jgi:hypothetical protein
MLEIFLEIIKNPLATAIFSALSTLGLGWMAFKFWLHQQMPEYEIWKSKALAQYRADWMVREAIGIPPTKGRYGFKSLINEIHTIFAHPNSKSEEGYATKVEGVFEKFEKEFEEEGGYFKCLKRYQPAIDRYEALKRISLELAGEMDKAERKIGSDQVRFNIIVSKWRILFKMCLGDLYDEEENELGRLVIKNDAKLEIADEKIYTSRPS